MCRNTLSLALIVFLVFSYFTAVPAGELYKWTDKNGTVHYSDSPVNIPDSSMGKVESTNSQSKKSHTTGWVKSSELEGMLGKMNENRMFPSYIEGRVDENQIVYKATFAPFPLNMDYFQSYWGMSDTWYEKRNEIFLRHGFKEHFHTIFTDLSGSTVHQATWVLIGK